MPFPKPPLTCQACGFPLTELRKIQFLPCRLCGGRKFYSGESNVRYVLREEGITQNDKKFLKGLGIGWPDGNEYEA